MASLFWVFACSNAKQKEIEAKDAEVMALHDEVMPKMGKLLNLRKQINAKIDACNTPGCKDSLQAISFMLTKADEDMMQWMRAFERPGNSDTALSYLENQKARMLEIKELTQRGMDAAEAALKP